VKTLGTITSHSEINVLISWSEIQVFFFNLEISVFHWNLCNNLLFINTLNLKKNTYFQNFDRILKVDLKMDADNIELDSNKKIKGKTFNTLLKAIY
jgi:hypothetical protein